MDKARLVIRQASPNDVDQILQLVEKAYHGMPPYPREMLLGQINNFPEGHLVALLDDSIVGYSASIRLPEEKVLRPHTWKEITGGGYGSTHDDNGDYLYGYEVCVDPTRRGYRIGQRFYNERKRLCKEFRLKGIIFAGRIPTMARNIKKYETPEKYIKEVLAHKQRDLVLSFQLHNGFEFLGLLKDYLPLDKDSLGYGAHLIWRNPYYNTIKVAAGGHVYHRSNPGTARVCCIQYGQKSIKSFDEFAQIVTYYVEVANDYHSDFILFPELFTMQLLTIDNEHIPPREAIAKMDRYTPKIYNLFSELAIKYNINIIGGSHPRKKDGAIYNVAPIFLRDGAVHEQAKIHPTPSERKWWNIQGGDKLQVINTDFGPIGVLICYDSEFPELCRYLVDQGINILFIPFLTDERQSYLRVRYCAQARAVENQIYVAMAGSVGHLPRIYNMDIHYSQTCLLSPCDFPFARDGVSSDTTPNVEAVAVADFPLGTLLNARSRGTVKNLLDRRHDLYRVQWLG